MDSRIIQLTAAAHKYGNLNIRSCGKDFFPPDVFGGSSRTKGIGIPIILQVEGLNNPIETDIPIDGSTGRPRWIFRERKWLKEFIDLYNLTMNDQIVISRINNRIYSVCPDKNHSQLKELNEMTKVATISKPKKHLPNKVKQVESVIITKPPKKLLDIDYTRICECPKTHINCLPAKEWLKSQLGVWQFYYESRDIRDKTVHPATLPISLAKKLICLFTHQGELVLDPFVGSGTTLIAANDLNRNSVGFDLYASYVEL
jgi:DNA modification methylase